MPRRVTLLVGSPRTASTSLVIGEYLLAELQKFGWESEIHRIFPALDSAETWRALSNAVADADLVVLAFPLYVDSMPSGVIRALEKLANERSIRPENKPQQFLAIVNSGFPEAVQIQTALAIAGRFAQEAGFEWAGGISIGGGGSINGKPLDEFGKMVHHLKLGLEHAAEALQNGRAIPEDATDLSIHFPIPKRLTIPIANLMWWFQARAHETQKRLREMPYGKE